MKCVNCGVEVDKGFTFAIKKNECPACGKSIMPPEQLASFNSLKELLANVPHVDAEMVASLVVANFELKQLFKTAPGKNLPEVSATGNTENVVETVEEDVVEHSEENMTDEELDQIHKVKQVAEARKKLNQMKQDAYEDALREQYGMGGSDADGEVADGAGDFFSGNSSPREQFDRMKSQQLQNERHNKMLSGAGGFTRSEG